MESHRQQMFRVHRAVRAKLQELPADAIALSWTDERSVIVRMRIAGQFRYQAFDNSDALVDRIVDWVRADA